MPLRVWRTDEVTALFPHPNDPGPSAPAGDGDRMELFTAFTLRVPDGTPDDDVRDTQAREAQRAAELARGGNLRRLWLLDSPPGRRALGLWRARDADELQRILDSLPLRPWLETEVTPLSVHPSDPEIAERAP
jgi:muconolactone delta-isomerase